MKLKIFIEMFLFIFLVSNLILAQQNPTIYKRETERIMGEQPERRHHIFDKLNNPTKSPYHQLPLLNEIITSNAIIPDFQVNENAGPNGARQSFPSVAFDGSGNFVMTWADERNGDSDIYAQRYFSDGTTLGTNFKVNDDQGIARQSHPSISADENGNFVIVWTDGRNGNYDIFAQRYSSDGNALGSNFKVNDQGSEWQGPPSISIGGNGNFIITWEDNRDGNYDIFAQRYSSVGTALGTNFQVNDEEGTEWIFFGEPSISADSGGNFIITWTDSYESDIYAQRYSSDGTSLGTNFRVSDEQGNHIYPRNKSSVSMDDDGNFVITWQDERDGEFNIFAQRYSSDGTALGMNFKVNDSQIILGHFFHGGTSISADSSGNFVITWMDERNGNWDIYAQRYSSDGTALGTNFKINDDQVSAGQNNSAISSDGKGNFVITWGDERNIDFDIYAQRYSSNGTIIGANFKVNDDQGSARQFSPSISTDDNGNFVIVWEDNRNGNTSIYAQRFSIDGTELGTNFKINEDQNSVWVGSHSIVSGVNGNFVIVWVEDRNGNDDIYAQLYSSNGTALGMNFKVNDDQGSEDQGYPCIAGNGNDNFVIVWRDGRNGNYDIYAQRYTYNGVALGTNFKVNDDQGSDHQLCPSVSTDNNGNFVIIWEDWRDESGIYAQGYSCDGTALGTNFKVIVDGGNIIGGMMYICIDISTDGNGNFVIAWEDYRNGYIDIFHIDIYAQRYSSDGTALGTNFMVNDVLGSGVPLIGGPSISMDAVGNFIFTWEDNRNGSSDIYAQRYSSDGTALGKNFRITEPSIKSQCTPDVVLWNDRIYTTWTDSRAGGTGFDIWANVLDWENPTKINEKEISLIPSEYMINQNYPNPFNPLTTIHYSLAKDSNVRITVHNTLGQMVDVLVNGFQSQGTYNVKWNAKNLPSGLYIYRFEADGFSAAKKMFLQK